jgi:hypothetical protein
VALDDTCIIERKSSDGGVATMRKALSPYRPKQDEPHEHVGRGE